MVPTSRSASGAPQPPGGGLRKDTSSALVRRSRTPSRTESSSRKPQAAESSVRVALRARPLNTAELGRGDSSMLRFVSNNRSEMQVVSASAGGRELVRNFQFDVCACETVSQTDFFQLSGITTLLDSALEGYLATVFAYGQTGSGKTYSMSGLEEKLGLAREVAKGEEPSDGLIPRSIRYLFDAVAAKTPDTTFAMKASYCEIYNEQAYDLLNAASGSLNVRWNDRNGFYVQNLLVVQCDSLDDVMAVVDEGHRNRRVGSHEMNKDSSRSHSILTITLDQEVRDPNDGHSVVKYGKISFVDLAGSERLKDTKSSNTEETSNINKSLLTLGKVISALGSKSNAPFVPYRDSKLTKLLMDSLGGNSLTLMIACISPSPGVMEDTLSTLNYATRAKNIQNKPTIQMDPTESLILGLRKENQVLRTENVYLKQQLLQATGKLFPSGAAPPPDALRSPSYSTTEGQKPPARIAPLLSKPTMPEQPQSASPTAADFESLNGVMAAYQNQLIFLQQENAQLHANQGYSEHRLKNLIAENESLQELLEKATSTSRVNQDSTKLQGKNDAGEKLKAENERLKQQLQHHREKNPTDFDILDQVQQMNVRVEQLQKREQELMMALVRRPTTSSKREESSTHM
ncbi:Aste57867_11949 [Aphanomyces stellatus]|uniref:Kinesin-like protein n=1 Tax=Aphanomyces stellatus TaxID=120398 RepID=A0A485KUB8_9STRA|nr:hypothetical protein As57867_011904 [Aphanomyces stellatus]VFT88804.1 Aste57867_11949 [Aphanomyces stellatus]